MTDHVHIYNTGGHCVFSRPLMTCNEIDDDAARAGATVGLRRTLLDMGVTLTDWDQVERAGLAASNGQTFIVRIKSDPVQRDMRAGGATRMIDDVRRQATPITAADAWMMWKTADDAWRPVAA